MEAVFRLEKSPQQFLVRFFPVEDEARLDERIADIRSLNDTGCPVLYAEKFSPKSFALIEKEGMSAFDLRGNSIFQVPPGIFIRDFRSSRGSGKGTQRVNPFRGRISLVSRALLRKQRWNFASSVLEAITSQGIKFSASLVSRSLQVLSEEQIIGLSGREIFVVDPGKLLDGLAAAWPTAKATRDSQQRRLFFNRMGIEQEPAKIPFDFLLAEKLRNAGVRFSLIGALSSSKILQQGPESYFVDNLDLAKKALQSLRYSPTPQSLADLVLIEYPSDEVFFDVSQPNLFELASDVQVYIELRNGDTRQQEAALEVRKIILGRFR